ncbi:uncharacterized protein LOC126674108 [Mercurialis annua]|uniref:uncharacterized protein LOC126674108 n=1 Tax=Mercurialis annua TaxID=3986 RepID=UPI00215F99B9|nr:uncharacterized protein LOC126674108 [Mercurialis annua]
MNFAHTLKYPTITCSFKPSSDRPHGIPARDRVIDFGKHNGKMLGALPSTYLKWVSKNLRAGDTEHWAKLVDQVLQDPVYQDRIEWEFAENLLNGNNGGSLSRTENAAAQLSELSERFGWDNEDKAGWSKVKFELLGTSKGGRIPRTASSSCCSTGFKEVEDLKEVVLTESEMRRKERRERVKVKMVGEKKKAKLGILMESKGKMVNGKNGDDVVEMNNPFPGREALYKRVLNNYKK